MSRKPSSGRAARVAGILVLATLGFAVGAQAGGARVLPRPHPSRAAAQGRAAAAARTSPTAAGRTPDSFGAAAVPSTTAPAPSTDRAVTSGRPTPRGRGTAPNTARAGARATSSPAADPVGAPAAATGPGGCGKPVRGVVRRIPTGPRRTVALTFDDGPSPRTTPKILAVLRRYHVHATFFVVGSHVAESPATLRRIVADGNRLGNHSWSHPLPGAGGAFDRLGAAAQAREIDRTQDAVRRATGVRPCLFRAPGGHDRSARLHAITKARGLTVVNWNHDTRDWAAPGHRSSSYQRAILTGATPPAGHDVVLMHDGPPHAYRGNTVQALTAVIKAYRRAGYTFTDPLGRPFD